MDLGLDGRRALVLGSSSGLGRAIAATLLAEGALVAVVSRDRERAADAAAELGAHAALVVDLVEPGAGDAVVADAVDALGGLDIVVVNTGGGTPGPILVDGRPRRCGVPLDVASGPRDQPRRCPACHRRWRWVAWCTSPPVPWWRPRPSSR